MFYDVLKKISLIVKAKPTEPTQCKLVKDVQILQCTECTACPNCTKCRSFVRFVRFLQFAAWEGVKNLLFPDMTANGRGAGPTPCPQIKSKNGEVYCFNILKDKEYPKS